jgi:hypothetical protein
MPPVFRWNITHREQLGRLIDGRDHDIARVLEQVRRCSARVIAMAGDARLVFVGRSPEPIHDYLTGAFSNTSWASRMTLLNLSLKSSESRWDVIDRSARDALCEHLRELRLDPGSIATGPHPVALVDIICEGDTFGALFDLLYAWSEADGVDVRAVRRRLRVVGITSWDPGDPSPVAWKELAWAKAFRPASLKGVSVPAWFWSYLGDSPTKVSRSNPPARWTDPEMVRPPRDDKHLDALGHAVALYEAGRTRGERDALAAAIAQQPSIRQVWCRTLAAELRAASRPKRVEKAFGSKWRVRSWNRAPLRR